MTLPDLMPIISDPSHIEHAKTAMFAAIGCASVLVVLSAWNRWGYPRWGKFMDARKREQDQLALMVDNAMGAFEYLISDQQMTPQDMWKLAPKFDNIPGFRPKFRDMLKKYLPEERKEETVKTGLSSLSLQN